MVTGKYLSKISDQIGKPAQIPDVISVTKAVTLLQAYEIDEGLQVRS